MLDISLRIKHEDKTYMIYATTDSPRCFPCGVFGHIRIQCPKQTVESTVAENSVAGGSKRLLLNSGQQTENPSEQQAESAAKKGKISPVEESEPAHNVGQPRQLSRMLRVATFR
uniref:CCHC-type domain-containing protein n=1 Tax=Anguilla anguilla TaxID=7936 RepID=A0A0E9RQY2_ANGAN